MAVNAPFVVAGQEEELFGLKSSVEEGKNLFLFVTVIDLLKLIQEDNAGLRDAGQEGVEVITMIRGVDNDHRKIAGDGNLTSQQTLAAAFFAGEQYAGIGRTGVERIQNTFDVLEAIAIHL